MVIKPPLAVIAAAAVLMTTIQGSASAGIIRVNVPPAQTIANTVRIPAHGGEADGTVTTAVTYTDKMVSATASTGNTIGLGQGFQFTMTTCVNWHRYGHTPLAYCSDRLVDTRSNSAIVYTNAPTVTLPDRPRPYGGDLWAYYDSYVEITYLSGSSYVLAAHSWPDNGLAGAAIPIAAVGQATGVLPANGTVGLDGYYSGAINTGQPDSMCRPQVDAATGSLPGGLITNHPGFPAAPDYYEVGLPTGSFANKAPLGVMLVINGGGWFQVGSLTVQWDRVFADRYRDLGWETVNLTYRGCGKSLVDALWFYDHARTWFGAGAAIGVAGGSAGGNLALLVAAQRPGVYAAISVAGPTNLGALKDQTANNQTNGPRSIYNLAGSAFGTENVAMFSPTAQVSPSLKTTRVLQAWGVTDPLVPYQQGLDLKQAILAANPSAYVDTVQEPAGGSPFVHTTVSGDGLNDYLNREKAIIAPITTPTVPLDKR